MNQLNQLIQEILDFSMAIDHRRNTDHADYQQACHLFCDYIEGCISRLSRPHPVRSLQDEEERSALYRLSMPAEYRARPYSHRINTLFNHCSQLQETSVSVHKPHHTDSTKHHLNMQNQ